MTLDDLLEDAKSKGNYHSETVNNQLDDTKIESTKRTGQLGMALSSSDSGVLRAIVKSDSSAIDSQIDLIHDSSQPNKPKSRSQAIQEASDRSRASSSSTPLIEPSASKSKTTNTVASKSGSTASPSTLGSKTPSASPKQPTSSSTKPSVPNTKSTSKPDEDSQEDQGLPLKSILIIIGVLAAIALVIAAVVFLKS
jgi:cobalamin biosynthesis Mg chelatase CobN